MRIAIVEDDIYLREELVQTIQRAGYCAEVIDSFDNVYGQLVELNPDLTILDVNLPGKSGYELCKALKARVSFPILILTARDALSDELTAFGLGADDFLTKPCHPDRLLARISRLLETYGGRKNVIKAGRVSLDLDSNKLSCQGRFLILTETERKIVALLMKRSPNIVSKRELFSAVWGTEDYIDENILQVNLSRLRKNFGELQLGDALKNVRGQGYVFEVGK